MSAFRDMFVEFGLSNSNKGTKQEPEINDNYRRRSVFADMFDAVLGNRSSQPATYPRQRGGERNQSMVSSSYDVYGKKLFAKEGGLRYDLFTGETTPSQPLDRLTIGQVKELQRKRKNTAAGAYQFTLSTLEDVQKEAGLSDDDLFDAKNQYRLFETFTRGNERHARERLGLGTLSDAQRYSLHFMGRYGGVDFLRKLQENPSAKFATLFPKAYAKNKALFSGIGGANATLADAFRELSNRMR